MTRAFRSIILGAGMAIALPALASAATMSTPTMATTVQGQAKVVALVVAGSTGAPAGFTIQWMRFSEFLANGGQWYADVDPNLAAASFEGTPTLNTWGGLLTTFELAPGAVAGVEIGDLYDETGVTSNARAVEELRIDTAYIFRCFANGSGATTRSAWSNNFIVDTTQNMNCTYTQGYWKNHEEEWPVASLMLGSVSYTQTELLAILDQPAAGNGLLILAHQLIATLLNVANGADDTDVVAAVNNAHAAIGALVIPPIGAGYIPPATASPIAQILDDYNNGIIGPGHCGSTSVEPSSWSNVKAAYR
jgi:hypothetical protein